ncbi:50S ribosomal protein L29 [Candidatus Saccharibacteria bacterium]|nr:50S ribosomal protein L29 [Candidatus Saccharibacteria bacterium]
MADKKVKKVVATKTTKKDTTAVDQTARDLRKLTEAELQTALKTAREDLLAAQKMLKANELPNSQVIKKSRQIIARIHTVLTEKIKEAKNV